MTLSDILGRDIRVEWQEAVALVRDIAELMPQESDVTSVPELHQVELLPVGQVEVHGGAATTDPVQGLVQMVQALLIRADPPVQLRLLLAQRHISVEAFSEALGFFERPDRAATLRDLYRRATVAAPLANHSALVAAAMASHADSAPEKGNRPQDRKQVRRRLVYAVAIGFGALLGAAALFGARPDLAPEAASPLTATVTRGITGAAAAVGSAVTAIGERVGLRGAAGEVPAATTTKADAQAVSTKPRASGRGSLARKPVASLPAVFAQVIGFDLNLPAAGIAYEPLAPTAQPSAVTTAPTDAVAAADAWVYTNASEGVSAPVGLRPQLPTELPAGVGPEDLTRIELLIQADGSVESVKLLDPPRDIHASMLLSAAKNWQFRPAMKDGLPVKYRKTVWVAR